MEQEYFDKAEEFLAHYGVKGMKWGVVKEQHRTISEASRKESGKGGTASNAALNLKTAGSLLERQKLESGDLRREAAKGKAFLDGKSTPEWKKDPSLAKDKDVDAIMSDVVKQINPDFGAPGTQMNCRRCTFAYEMRRRGLDVMATETTNASGQHIVGLKNAITPGQDKATRGAAFIKEANKLIKEGANMWGEDEITFPEFNYKKFKQEYRDENGKKPGIFKRWEAATAADSMSKSTAIYDSIAKQGDGARGELGVAWAFGGGHSVAYENVKGKTVVFDTQSGKKYDSPKAFADEFGPMTMSASTVRLDNKPLNDDYLLRWVQNR